MLQLVLLKFVFIYLKLDENLHHLVLEVLSLALYMDFNNFSKFEGPK